ncbi:hypothetical protein EV363DRAFT_1195283, partial [Boletus edulis]
EYFVLQQTDSLIKIHNEYHLPWSVFVGIAGLSGKTAYFGWKEHSRAKKGEVAFVTSGAGAVGSFVIQLAKRDGMRVIASAGSDDKVEFLKELGADVAFNYKTTKTSEILAKEGPINVYWDNVGGETLEAALNAAAKHARFIELMYREVVTRGLENAEVAFDNFMKGALTGKSVVILIGVAVDLVLLCIIAFVRLSSRVGQSLSVMGPESAQAQRAAFLKRCLISQNKSHQTGLGSEVIAALGIKSTLDDSNANSKHTTSSISCRPFPPMTVTNKRIIFKEYPKGLPIPGQTTTFDASQTIDLDNVPLNGGILVKLLVLSLEPYIMARMQPFMPVSLSLQHPTIECFGIGVVLRSEKPAFQVGDHLHGSYPFQEYSVLRQTESFTKIHNEYNLPWSAFVGIAGLPGKTAYFGWKEHSRAKKGEVAFVTSGAGAVGSFVIQLAKRDGMKVIASAGSDDKVEFLKELGADVAFNYKTTKTSEILTKEGPINVYWDNVGGETLEAALNAAAKHARFIEISMNGFIVSTLSPKYLETFEREVPALVASKELMYREDVTRGLENVEVAFGNLMKGALTGKGVVIMADK